LFVDRLMVQILVNAPPGCKMQLHESINATEGCF
jgi:hypothetical protein